MATINTICHAIKIIIRLTETLRTSLLTLANSIYIIGGIGRISKTQFCFHTQEHTFWNLRYLQPKRRLQRYSLLKSDQNKVLIRYQFRIHSKTNSVIYKQTLSKYTKWQHLTHNNYFSMHKQQLNLQCCQHFQISTKTTTSQPHNGFKKYSTTKMVQDGLMNKPLHM